MTKQDIIDALTNAVTYSSTINLTTPLSDQEIKNCLNSVVDECYTVNPDNKTYPGIKF